MTAVLQNRATIVETLPELVEGNRASTSSALES